MSFLWLLKNSLVQYSPPKKTSVCRRDVSRLLHLRKVIFGNNDQLFNDGSPWYAVDKVAAMVAMQRPAKQRHSLVLAKDQVVQR